MIIGGRYISRISESMGAQIVKSDKHVREVEIKKASKREFLEIVSGEYQTLSIKSILIRADYVLLDAIS